MAESERLFQLLDDIASELLMVDRSDEEGISAVREMISEVTSSIQVLLSLEEENKELRGALGKLQEADELLEDPPGDDEDFNKTLENIGDKFDSVEMLLRDYSRGVDSGETGAGGMQEETAEETEDELEKFNTKPGEYDEELFFDFYSEASEHLTQFEDNMLVLENNPSDIDAINESFRAMHSIKGMAGFLNFKFINNLAHKMENMLDLFREGLKIDSASVDILLKGLDLLKELVNLHHTTIKTGKKQEFDPARVRRFQKKIQEKLEELEKTGEEIEEVVETAEPKAELKQTGQIKVDLTKIDRLVNMAGELVTTFHQLKQQDNTQKTQTDNKIMNQMDRVVSDLQDDALALRMVPLKKTFNKMKRLVRDLSKEFGKDVNLRIKGGETELDRTLVEKIQDPLVHLVRNAIDHGLEMPEERKEAGKNPTGKLTLSAYHESGNVIIEIKDDGAGIEPDKILELARKRNVISDGEELEKKEILSLIFEPGFSTSEQVTNVSGRGVGMDVVRSNIKEINGDIEIDSEPGAGTTFKLKIPLTLSIISGMMIRVGNQKFILPTLDIRQSLRPSAGQITTVENRGQVLNVRGELITILRLDKIFDTGSANQKQDITDSMAVIVSGNGKPAALIVDDLLGQQEVVIKKLGASFSELKGISGAAILGDGNVGLIIDPRELTKTCIG